MKGFHVNGDLIVIVATAAAAAAKGVSCAHVVFTFEKGNKYVHANAM